MGKRNLQLKQYNLENKCISTNFDNALPESLQIKNISHSKEKKLRLQKNLSGIISPYVIHLSDKEVANKKINKNRLDQLAEELITDPDLIDDDFDNDIDLEVRLDELQEQLKEFDLQITSRKKVTCKLPEYTESIAIPVKNQNKLDDINTEIIFNDTKKEKNNVTQNKIEIEPTTIEIQSGLFNDAKATISHYFAGITILQSSPVRAVSVFLLLAMIFILPMQVAQGFAKISDSQDQITNSGRDAINNLMRGAAALESDDFDIASNDFERASNDFKKAENTLSDLNIIISTLAGIIPKTDNALNTAEGLTTAGRALSDAASTLAVAADELSGQKSTNLVIKLEILETYIKSALPDVETAEKAIAKIDTNLLPAEYQKMMNDLEYAIPSLKVSMDEFLIFSDTLTTILGQERKMKYLITFQNNTELRATGGFIGSFAEIDILNGEIVNINIPEGGAYDFQGQLSEFVESPEPLGLINPRWEFHDANWFPDFSISAKKLLWFYKNAGGPTVDGVIAINASMIPELLKITGPIEMESYDRIIDSENFLFETQKIVEFEYEQYQNNDPNRKEEAPKQFIGDLATILLEKITNSDMTSLLAMTQITGNQLQEKNIQLYFVNNDLQAQMELLGWSGTQMNTSGDYLMVVNTNLGGGKTDSVIDQDIDLDININEDGKITNTVTITKTHRGLKSTLFEGVNNVDYIRLYVPKGANLIEANGFEIPNDSLFDEYEFNLKQDIDLAMLTRDKSKDPVSKTDIWEENGKTVFGNWIQTAPGETQVIQFTYELPFEFKIQTNESNLLKKLKSSLGFKNLEDYTIYIQKQSGADTRLTNINISWPNGSTVIWKSHEWDDTKNISINNEKDNFLRFLIENIQ